MAAPTAESLRQSMLAIHSRILGREPVPPDLYIKSVAINDATFLILDQSVYFSSQFTAVIGGRASGKSTLLEYVRYALGISALDTNEKDWEPTYDRRRELLEATLSNAIADS